MKTCASCGASASDAARFCSECSTAFPGAPAEEGARGADEPRDRAPGGASLARSIAERARSLQGKRQADVLFILDCTGSMQGEIDAIKDAITPFARTIESDGVRVRVGLVEFRDRLINEEHRVLLFRGQPFTSDPAAFQREVGALSASGGGDFPESSLDAVLLALRQPFADDAQKVLVLITDAPPHVPDKDARSVEEVKQAIRLRGVHQFYLVIRLQDPASQIYLKLLEGTRGLAFELGTGEDFRNRAEHFKRTLMSLGKTISSATR